MDKPRIHTRYYYIELNDDWSDYRYAMRENIMDQNDRYNFATGNWSYDLSDLESRTYELLQGLTCFEDPDVAAIMFKETDRTAQLIAEEGGAL